MSTIIKFCPRCCEKSYVRVEIKTGVIADRPYIIRKLICKQCNQVIVDNNKGELIYL